MFAATKLVWGGSSGETEAYLRAVNVTTNSSQITVPAGTQPNDLLIYLERAANPVSIIPDFTMLVSVSSATGRGASLSYKVATTADTTRTLGGQTFGQKILFVVYSNLDTPIYTPVSFAGQITDSKPANQSLVTTSVSGTTVLLAAFAQTLGTSAARGFTVVSPVTIVRTAANGFEARLALNEKVTCTASMADEGSLNTMFTCSFAISET